MASTFGRSASAGQRGPRGPQGVGISTITYDDPSDEIVFTMTDSTQQTISFPGISLDTMSSIHLSGPNSTTKFTVVDNSAADLLVADTTNRVIRSTGDLVGNDGLTDFFNASHLSVVAITGQNKGSKFYVRNAAGTIIFNVDTSTPEVSVSARLRFITGSDIAAALERAGTVYSTGLDVSGTVNLGGLTASTLLQLDASKNIVTSSTISTDLTLAKAGTAVTESLNINAGLAGTASTANVSRIVYNTMTGGGGTATATSKLFYDSTLGYTYHMTATDSVSVGKSFLPDTNNSYTLGNSSRKWSSLYTNTITDSGTDVVVSGSSASTMTPFKITNTGVGGTVFRVDANNGTNTFQLNVSPNASAGVSFNRSLYPSSTGLDLGTSTSVVRSVYATNMYAGNSSQYINMGIQGANNTIQFLYTNSVASDKAIYFLKSDSTNDRILDVNTVRCTSLGPQSGTIVNPLGTTNTVSFGSSGQIWKDIWAGNTVIQTSDQTKKTDIAAETLGLTFINALTPKSFKFIDGTSGRTHHGLIAQEVEAVIAAQSLTNTDFAGLIKDTYTPMIPDPEAIGETPAVFIPDPEATPQVNYGLRYCEFIGPLIKAVQELTARVEALEALII